MKWITATFFLFIVFSCEKNNNDNATIDFEIDTVSFKAGEECFLVPKIVGNFCSINLKISEIGFDQTHENSSPFSFTVPQKGPYTFELIMEFCNGDTKTITKIIEAKPGNGNIRYTSAFFQQNVVITVTGKDYNKTVNLGSVAGNNRSGAPCDEQWACGFENIPGGIYTVNLNGYVFTVEVDNNCVKI